MGGVRFAEALHMLRKSNPVVARATRLFKVQAKLHLQYSSWTIGCSSTLLRSCSQSAGLTMRGPAMPSRNAYMGIMITVAAVNTASGVRRLQLAAA